MKRTEFLREWIQNSEKSIIHKEGGTIKGYGILRKSWEGYRIGPLFADEK